jgi:hypothetical protein
MREVSPLSPVLVAMDISKIVGRFYELRKLSELTPDLLERLLYLANRRLRFRFFHHRRANRLAFFNQLDLAMVGKACARRN